MAFVRKPSVEANHDSIESLFMDIRTRKIDSLYAHQSDVIKLYEEKHRSSSDLAIELPTGSGKTLIGLLIGEYLRKTKGEKVLFLCATNQLVNQVVDQANSKYSIGARAFTGSKSTYSSEAKTEFKTAKTIAVTNYSSLFNINPFFDPDVIIFDDAHVAENYIANNWSFTLDRTTKEELDLYKGLLSILKECLSYSEFNRLNDDDPDPMDKKTVHLIPTHLLYTFKDHIVDYFSALDSETQGNLYYTWQKIKDRILSCQFYISWKSILIRPIIPPTFDLSAFTNARQRIFMSATLGAGGDLERVLGIKKIERIPLPHGWDKRGSGRRFFVFPDMSMDKAQQDELYVETNKIFDRSLALVPDWSRLNYYADLAKEKLKYDVFDGKALELSKKTFVETKGAVAIVANRYEGIDMEGDDCRLLFVINLPKTVNLQETFLFQRMGSMVVLHDRIRTRIIQALGRCTRGSADYACVVVMGEDISEYFLSNKFRRYFHPELQAEISFGIRQSDKGNLKDIIENIQIFLKQDKDWAEVEIDIFAERDHSTQIEIPGFNKLAISCAHEVDFQMHMWNLDYRSAVNSAQLVLDNLNASELDGYRGFWNYLASVSCFLAYKEYNRSEFSEKASAYLKNASSIGRTLPWLRKLSELDFSVAQLNMDWDSELSANIEKLDDVFSQTGISSTVRFEKEMSEIQENLMKNDAPSFERSQVLLGRYLGFESVKDKRQGAPDPFWISNNKICLVFEDNTGKTNDKISISKTRQAKEHREWILHNVPNSEKLDIHCVLVSDAEFIDKEAISFSKDVYYWQLEDYRAWAKGAILAIRTCRTSYFSNSPVWREHAMKEFLNAKIDPRSIVERATKVKLQDIPLK